MKNKSTEILLAVVMAIAGWNLLETISLGKAVAAIQAEIHKRDAQNDHEEKTSVANSDIEPVRSVRRLRDFASAAK